MVKSRRICTLESFFKMSKKNSSLKPIKKIYVTASGLKEAKIELEDLRSNKRAQVAERIQKAREFGDLAENAEYDMAMDEQVMVENKISELENLLKNVQVIQANTTKNDFVTIGSTVVIEMDGSVDEFTIVGRMEADPSKKRISNESPLGTAILGAKVGEIVEVQTPIVRYKCKIVEVK